MDKKPNPARQAYLKQWRKEHPEKISQYNKKYWERRAVREEMAREEEERNARRRNVSNN